MPGRPFRIHVADLLRHPRARRSESVEGVLDGLDVTGSRVEPGSPVALDVELAWVRDGAILVTGTARARWRGDCVRCLRPVTGRLGAGFQELFEDHPVEGDSYPLSHDQVDLEPLAREVVLLELPQVPVCRHDCAGLCPRCGADLNEGPHEHPDDRDPRWAALDALGTDQS